MNRRTLYFLKQKLIGVFTVIFGIFATMRMRDLTPAVIMTPLGLSLIFSKKMIWMDKYFFEVEQKKINKRP
jgi:hypothetical protein